MTDGEDGVVAINCSLELQPLFHANQAIVDLDYSAGEIVEPLVEARETQVHVRTQVADAPVLEIEADSKNYQRQTKRGKELGIAHKPVLPLP